MIEVIGQLKFAWIDIKRSFLGSIFTIISQIITYSAITISIGMFSLTRANLQNSLNFAYRTSYTIMTVLFIIVCIIIGIVVTIRSIELKFQSQREDIAVMKNVGGKSRWIYSYFVFNQILTAIIMLILGIIIGLVIIVGVSVPLGVGNIFNYIGFIPILVGNLIILISSYLKAHYTILRFIGEKDFEISSSRLSNYKSIFEFNALIDKFTTPIKIGIKNFLRSGKILTSFLFSFFLIFSSISFILGPMTVAETHVSSFDNRFGDYSYAIGTEGIVDLFNQSLPVQKYENSSFISSFDYPGGVLEYFYNTVLSTQMLEDINELGITYSRYFISKLEIQEISGYDIINEVYLPIGEERVLYATIIGYYNEINIEEEEFVWGNIPDNARNQVLIGDTLEEEFFVDSTAQEIKFHDDSEDYKISGTIIDSFAAGYTVYCPIGKLMAEGITNGTNMIMFQDLNNEQYNEVVSILDEYQYKISSIEDMTEETQDDYNNYTIMLKTLSSILFSIFAFQIVVYTFLYFINYRKDFELLYRLGVKRINIYTTVITSVFLQIIPGIALGSYFGSIIGRFFLIPNAILSNFALVTILIVLGFIILATMTSIYASKKGLEKVAV